MTQRVIQFTKKNFKFMLANMTADDVIHDYGIGKEDRWEANKDLLIQFQRDRFTFMNPRMEGGVRNQSIAMSPSRTINHEDPTIHPGNEPGEVIFPFSNFFNQNSPPFISVLNSEEQEESTFFDNLVKHELAYYNALDLLVEDVKTEILFIIFSNIINRRKLELDAESKSNKRKRESIQTDSDPNSKKNLLMDLYYYITDGSEFMEDIYLKFAGYLNNNQKYLTDIINELRIYNISGIRQFLEDPQTDIMIAQMYQEQISHSWDIIPDDPDLGGGTTKYTGGASLKLTGDECKIVRLRVYNFMNNIGLLHGNEIDNFNQFLIDMNITFNNSQLGTVGRYTTENRENQSICDKLNGDDGRQYIIIINDNIFGQMLDIFIAFTTDEGNPDRDTYINNLKRIADECANVFEYDGQPQARILEIRRNTILVPTITKSSRGYQPTSDYFYAHLKNRLLAYLSDYQGIITVTDLAIQRREAAEKRAKEREEEEEARAAAAQERAEERARAGHLGPDDVKFREGFCSFIAKASLHMCNIITATATAPTADNPTQLTWALYDPDDFTNPYLKRQAEILCKWADITPSLLGLESSRKDADTELFNLFTTTFQVNGRKRPEDAKSFLTGISRNENRKIIIDNAAMSRSDVFYHNKFCPWSSINDAQSMCSANTDDSIEYGNMNFKIQNNGQSGGYYECQMIVLDGNRYNITFTIVFPNGNTVTHTIEKGVGDGFLKAKNAVGETIGGIIDYLVKTSTPGDKLFDQAFTDRVFSTFPNIFDQLFIEFLNGYDNGEIMKIIFKNILCKLLGDLLQEINSICAHGGYTGVNYNTTPTGNNIVGFRPNTLDLPNTPRIFLANDRPSAFRAMFAAHFAVSGINTNCSVAYYPDEDHIFMYSKPGATFTGGKTRKRIKLNKKTKKMSQSNRKTKKNKQRNSKKIKSKYYNKYVKKYSK
jgi:hypothetical protein